MFVLCPLDKMTGLVDDVASTLALILVPRNTKKNKENKKGTFFIKLTILV